jgi:hypothetical protein
MHAALLHRPRAADRGSARHHDAEQQGSDDLGGAAGLGIIQAADYYTDPHIRRGDLVGILRAFKTDG